MDHRQIEASILFLLGKYNIWLDGNGVYHQHTDCEGDFNPDDHIHCAECKFLNTCKKNHELIGILSGPLTKDDTWEETTKAEIEIPVKFNGREHYSIQITMQEIDDNGELDELWWIINLERDDNATVEREMEQTGSRQEESFKIPKEVTKVKVIITGKRYNETIYKLI